MKRLRPVLVVAAVAASAMFGFGAAPAHAGSVTVNFGLSVGAYAPTGAACAVEVPAGASGITVLDAAQAKGCIVSYKTTSASFGTFVSCINEVCGVDQNVANTAFVGTYWSMYENGGFTSYGVDGFTAGNGDELVFAYSGYAF